ncbi:uncharacterized protein LOC118763768 [Octopus sinensis]|uniref:Uncharacterized protein LOC118763768 n=1 Tax=Octopus sinensis TaxID=2607531 RepID=A0A7E6EVJ3_9MOLL|nr:uncharacterized protein LOC118763768 [Octopus sinensis]
MFRKADKYLHLILETYFPAEGNISRFPSRVAAMNWTGEHRAFIVETFIKTNDSVTATQRAFRLHFNLGRHDPVPARNTILFMGYQLHSYWICFETKINPLNNLKMQFVKKLLPFHLK